MSATIHQGDCLAVMRAMHDASVDAVVTDPPYGLRFMGSKWDADVPSAEIWRECLRVLKPGGYLLSFFGTRTYHRGVVQIEDAGFEIRDCVAWVYGMGFPKSLDISKAIDKAAGAEREVVEKRTRKLGGGNTFAQDSWSKRAREEGFDNSLTAPATPAARQWNGWGTALKPAFEPIVLARAPLSESTVAANVLKHGTGGLNVKGCAIGTKKRFNAPAKSIYGNILDKKDYTGRECNGRWPANLVHDGSPEVLALMPDVGGGKESGYDWRDSNNENATRIAHNIKSGVHFGDSGSAARFFYCAKASRAEREKGCEKMTYKLRDDCPDDVKKEIEKHLTLMR